jgi:phospholipid/cholesterol/gamma-HCH transport system ATP-binding protein
MIELKNIKKGFGDKVVINDVSAIMETGKANLIIGSSGSGKTVLMKCLVGLFEPDHGEILYDGKNFTEMTDDERKMLRSKSACCSRDQPCSTV